MFIDDRLKNGSTPIFVDENGSGPGVGYTDRKRECGMTLDLENDELFSSAIEGLPKVAELIATVPESKLSLALWAARPSYRQIAQNAGLR